MITKILSIAVLGIFAASMAQANDGGREVDCDAGMSLAKAIQHAPAGTSITVKGTCHERVTIKRDRIKLTGDGTSGLDGSGLNPAQREFNPLIRVADAVGVVIENLFVRNSPAEGLIVEGKANVQLQNVAVHNNSNVGMLVDHARVEVSGGQYDGNQGGIDVTNTGSAIMRGAISLQNNIVFGIAASNGAAIEARGTVMNASNNQLGGVLLESGHLAIFNFGVSQGSQILADGNGVCGFILVGGGFLDVVAPPPLQFSGVNLLRATSNGGCGFLMTTGSKLESVFGAATIQIEGNPVGMSVSGNSDVAVNGGLNIVNNFGPGLVADGAGVLNFAPFDPSPPPALATLIQDNGGPDVILNFGSRATFAANVTVGSLVCDGTALARGAATCP